MISPVNTSSYLQNRAVASGKTDLMMPETKPRKAQPKAAKRAAPKATITEQLRKAMPKGRTRTIASLAASLGTTERAGQAVRVARTA